MTIHAHSSISTGTVEPVVTIRSGGEALQHILTRIGWVGGREAGREGWGRGEGGGAGAG